MENTSGKGSAQKLARGAQMLKGAKNMAEGFATGNYVTAAKGLFDFLSPEAVAVIFAIVLFFVLLPVIIISALPQLMFSWATVNDRELIARNVYAGEIVQMYETRLEEQPEGVKPDILWLISIESVLHKQKVEDITKRDVDKSFERSYTIDEETGAVVNNTPEEMMNELGFSDEEKNWAYLMYSCINEQYIAPDSNMADTGTEQQGTGGQTGIPTNLEGMAGEMQVTYFSQIDERWKNVKYGKSGTIGTSGCGPTALAIVVSTLTGQNITPVDTAKWSVNNGHRCEGNGSYHSLIPKGAEHYGLKVEKLGRSSAKELARHLSSGKLVIAIMAKGHFTTGGHFIVLRGITSDGKVLVADPASVKRSNREWDMSIILNEAKGTASAGGPFWSISR